jgi:hypothetical protein
MSPPSPATIPVRRLLLILGLMTALPWVFTGSARPEETSSGQVSSEPVFTGLRVDGQTVTGRIVAIGPEEITLASEENARQDLPLRSLVNVSREPRNAPQPLDGSHLLFPDGDRLMRVIVGATGDTALEVQSHSALGKLTIPLDAVLGLVLAPPGESDAFDHLWEQVRGEKRTTDVVWMANGDRQTGGFLGLDDRVVNFQVEGKPVEIDRTGVIAVGFDPAVANYPRPTADYLDVTLADGSRLGLVDVKLDKGQVTATSRFNQSLRFPISDLVRLEPRTPAVEYLSERPIDAQSYESYFGPTREARRDRTIDDHRFQLRGRVYDRGLGTQSRTLLAYRLKPGDRRFQALVGVDDRAGPLGSVVFRVLVDKVPKLTTPPMTARDLPRPVDIDISQAKSLILITEFGDRGDVRDHADWVEARIIR